MGGRSERRWANGVGWLSATQARRLQQLAQQVSIGEGWRSWPGHAREPTMRKLEKLGLIDILIDGNIYKARLTKAGRDVLESWRLAEMGRL